MQIVVRILLVDLLVLVQDMAWFWFRGVRTIFLPDLENGKGGGSGRNQYLEVTQIQ